MVLFNKMLLSILVPIYGVENYIKRCAISLFEQTLENNIEFIFVNDCTKDRSVLILLDLLQRYPHRAKQVTVIEHDRNRGLAASRQTALNHAKGDYVLTVDSDDWLEKDACEKVIKIACDTKCDIVVFDYYANYISKQIHCHQQVYSTGEKCLKSLMCGKMHGGTCTKLIKRELYTDNDIQYVEGLNMLEDISVVYRIFYYAKSIEYLQQPLYHYYQGNLNSYCTNLSLHSKENMLQLIGLMGSFFKNNPISVELIVSFECFKIRVGILLLLASSSFDEYLNYIGFFKFKQFSNLNLLSGQEKLICNMVRYTPLFFSYIGIISLKIFKNLKLKIYNLNIWN